MMGSNTTSLAGSNLGISQGFGGMGNSALSGMSNKQGYGSGLMMMGK